MRSEFNHCKNNRYKLSLEYTDSPCKSTYLQDTTNIKMTSKLMFAKAKIYILKVAGN